MGIAGIALFPKTALHAEGPEDSTVYYTAPILLFRFPNDLRRPENPYTTTTSSQLRRQNPSPHPNQPQNPRKPHLQHRPTVLQYRSERQDSFYTIMSQLQRTKSTS